MSVIVVIAMVLSVLWGLSTTSKVGSPPRDFAWRRPQLVPFYEALTGRRKEFDAVLLDRGLLVRSDDGSVRRPAQVDAYTGDYVDLVRFRPLPGTATAWESAMPELCHLFGQRLALDSSQPGVLDIEYWHTTPAPPADPLADPIVQDELSVPSAWALRIGVDEADYWVDVPLADRAGAVVGGQPGSGKTGSLRTMAAGFAALRNVQMAVVDGKGGSDWKALAPRCFSYISTSDNLDAVATFLRSIETERARRVGAMERTRGSSNFWDAGPGRDLPLIVVIIDECQAFLSKSLHVGKAARDRVDEITGLLQILMSQGRSAGVFCILATQKPTTDSIPSAIRESAGIRLAYSVLTRQSGEAILGDAWSAAESGVTPVGQPQGVAIFSDGMGRLSRIRSPFAPEQEISQWVSVHAHAASDPRQAGLSA